jgi:hypothetical protein
MSNWNPARRRGPRPRHQDVASIDYRYPDGCLDKSAEDVLEGQPDYEVVAHERERAERVHDEESE